MELPFDDTHLNGYLDEMVAESRRALKDLDKDKEWDENMRFYRGRQWQERLPSHRIAFVANYTKTSVKRLVALMTDTKPTIDVHTSLPGLGGMVSGVLTPAVRANWDEQNYDQKLSTGLLPMAIVMGSAVGNSCFNPSLDDGRGDVDLGIIDPRSFIVDPTIVRAADIDEADYAGYQTVAPLTRIWRLFPRRGREVEPSASASRFLEKSGVTSGFDSPGHRILSRSAQSGTIQSFAVKRAPIQEFFVTDHRLVKELPTAMQEQAFTRGLTGDEEAWPGGRRIIRAGYNKIILSDVANPYIDRRKPYVMFDWGLEIENPWGDSEVTLIKSLQAILNKLSSAITENAIKMNNNIWIGDKDALEKHEWNQLNDAPGLLVKLKQGRTLRRESPPPLPGSVFQMLQWIVTVIDTLTGLVDATQGRRPVGLVCADLETECLTKRGWLHCDDVLETDEIYTFNPQTEQGEWSPLLAKTVAQWQGDVHVVDSPRIDAVVTPNHGWLVGSTNWQKNQEREAQYHHRNPRNEINWVTGPKFQRVEMQDINVSHYIPADFPLIEEKPSVQVDDFVRLVGWVVTDGYYEFHKRQLDPIRRNDTYAVGVTQSLKANPDKCKEIERILQSLRIPYSVKYGPNAVLCYRFRGRWAREFQAQFPDKRPGYAFMNTLTTSQLQYLYEAMMAGDGSVSETNHASYSSSDQELLDQFQFLVTLLGSTSVARVTNIERPRHRRECYGPHRSLSINSREHIQWRAIITGEQITTRPYDGQVWCPTTTTGTWLARRNGKVYLTHNSSNAIEALNLSAQVLIRLQTRKLESFLERLGQRMIARIFQFYTADRLMHLVGPSGKLSEFHFKREELIGGKIKNPDGTTRDFDVFSDLRDLTFRVSPGSSMAVTRQQKGQMAMALAQAGYIPRKEVLKALEWDDPEQLTQEALAEAMSGQKAAAQAEPPQKRARVAA